MNLLAWPTPFVFSKRVGHSEGHVKRSKISVTGPRSNLRAWAFSFDPAFRFSVEAGHHADTFVSVTGSLPVC